MTVGYIRIHGTSIAEIRQIELQGVAAVSGVGVRLRLELAVAPWGLPSQGYGQHPNYVALQNPSAASRAISRFLSLGGMLSLPSGEWVASIPLRPVYAGAYLAGLYRALLKRDPPDSFSQLGLSFILDEAAVRALDRSRSAEGDLSLMLELEGEGYESTDAWLLNDPDTLQWFIRDLSG